MILIVFLCCLPLIPLHFFLCVYFLCTYVAIQQVALGHIYPQARSKETRPFAM